MNRREVLKLMAGTGVTAALPLAGISAANQTGPDDACDDANDITHGGRQYKVIQLAIVNMKVVITNFDYLFEGIARQPMAKNPKAKTQKTVAWLPKNKAIDYIDNPGKAYYGPVTVTRFCSWMTFISPAEESLQLDVSESGKRYVKRCGEVAAQPSKVNGRIDPKMPAKIRL